MDHSDVQNTVSRTIADLAQLETQLSVAPEYKQATNDVRRAIGLLTCVRIAGRQCELAASVREGDMVILKHRGHGTFKGFIKSHPGQACVERNGYGVGWFDVEDIELPAIDELKWWVEQGEKDVAEWKERPGRDRAAPDRVAGWRRQLDRLTAEA